jgi:type 1 glutamine amidotransferase
MSDFDITDEIYNYYDVKPGVHVLLTTDHPGSGKVIAWTHTYQKSPVVYLLLGHDHTAYQNPNYRRLVERAILWVGGRLNQAPGPGIR